MELTHLNEAGRGHMVDVSDKEDTRRTARARGTIRMHPDTISRIKEGSLKKGDVLGIAQIAGVMAAKRTWETIPLCHNILLQAVDIEFEIAETEVTATSLIQTIGKTGAEMEALNAVTTALLTVYDMCKAIDKEMTLSEIRVIEKSGGKSGHYQWEEAQADKA